MAELDQSVFTKPRMEEATQLSIEDIGVQESFLVEGVNHPKEIDHPPKQRPVSL